VDTLAGWAVRAALSFHHRDVPLVTSTPVVVTGSAPAASPPVVIHDSATPTPANPEPLSTGRACGGGLFAGANTTCAFAAKVRDAYDQASGGSQTVEAYSPVTGQTYTMRCDPAGDGVTCEGGNNASVHF
jgi:hypothetical protein